MHRMHGARSGGIGEASEYNAIDDFDLFWGMGPSRHKNNQIAHQHQQPHHQQQLDVVGSVSTVGSGMSVAPSHSSSAGGSVLNSSNLSMGGGGLWAHGTEAYGHRHHIHLQDVALNDPGIVGSKTSKSGLTSPKRAPTCSPHRAVWPSPNHTSSSRNDSPLQMRQQQHPTRSLDMVVNTGHDNINTEAGAGVCARLAAPAASAGSDHPSRNSNNRSVVDSKLEELAAAITSSVLGKLDVGVREALLSQKHHQQQQQQQNRSTHGAPHTPSSSAYASSETAATVVHLRSRLTALEEQVGELKATIARKPTRSPSFSQRSLGDDGSMAGENESRVPQAPRGPQGSSGSRGGGRAGNAGANSGNGGDRDTLEQSLAALAQRTGTLEGRHKQVQAKVALLDSAFGSKASDWAQTIRNILIEREVAAANAGGGGTGSKGVTSVGRATGKGSKKSSANSTATSASTSQASSQGDECVNNRFGSGGAGPDSSNKSGTGAKQVATARGTESTKGADGGDGASNKSLTEIAPHANGQSPQNPPPELVEIRGRECDVNKDDKRRANSAAVDRSSSRSQCAACADTEARCNQLEARVFESERVLAMLQKQANEVTGQAAAAAKAAEAAAAAAEAETAKAAEAATASAASAAVAGKAAADAASTAATMVETKRDADAASGEAGSGACSGRHQQKSAAVATAASLGVVVDKLASDLKLLSERTKEGEDGLALVDHGLRGIRDQIAPMSGSYLALKRVVETHLREKEQASEMLKGYVTTITREVATITRQYINGLVAPGRIPDTAATAPPVNSATVELSILQDEGVHSTPDAATSGSSTSTQVQGEADRFGEAS